MENTFNVKFSKMVRYTMTVSMEVDRKPLIGYRLAMT